MSSVLANSASRLLGVIRLATGGLGLLAPRLLLKRFESPSEGGLTPPPQLDLVGGVYAFRLFGIRTILLGLELLYLQKHGLSQARIVAPLIHATDTVSAITAVRGSKMARTSKTLLVGISALNTVLSLAALSGFSSAEWKAARRAKRG
jgi:hypothetical protein